MAGRRAHADGAGVLPAGGDLQQHYAAGRRVTNSLQTNGVLLDDAWGAFLARHGFLVGLSLDGPRALHDAYRVDRGGRPTWSRVMRGLRTLKRHRVQFNTLTVVHRHNYRHAREVYEFLRDEGSRFMQFIPLVERRAGTADTAARLDHAPPPAGPGDLVHPERAAEVVAAECAPREGLGEFLCAIFDLWVRRDVGRVFVQQFDVALSTWCGLGAGLCIFEERCGRALALEHNGDVYGCDHYVYPAYRLGNVHATPLADIGNGGAAARFGDAKANLPARLSRMSGSVCLQRRLSEAPLRPHGGWRARGQLPLSVVPALLHAHRPGHAPDGGVGAARGASPPKSCTARNWVRPRATSRRRAEKYLRVSIRLIARWSRASSAAVPTLP